MSGRGECDAVVLVLSDDRRREAWKVDGEATVTSCRAPAETTSDGHPRCARHADGRRAIFES